MPQVLEQHNLFLLLYTIYKEWIIASYDRWRQRDIPIFPYMYYTICITNLYKVSVVVMEDALEVGGVFPAIPSKY